jgi:chromosome segregation ATPase
MNNISALNHVFVGINQNLTSLSQRMNHVVVEIESLRSSLAELKNASNTIDDDVPSRMEFEKITQDLSEFKAEQVELVNKMLDIENNVDKALRQVKEVTEQVSSLSIVVDNVRASEQNITMEEVQGMIDKAISSLINVFTSASTNVTENDSENVLPVSSHLPSIPELLVETEVEEVPEIQIETLEVTETVSFNVQNETPKKKSRGGRKPKSSV